MIHNAGVGYRQPRRIAIPGGLCNVFAINVLAFAVARLWPGVLSNAVEPGWVPTKMGGPGAPDDLSLAPVTQAWIAVSDDPAATVTGRYFYHQRHREPHPASRDPAFQDDLLSYCADLTGTPLPP